MLDSLYLSQATTDVINGQLAHHMGELSQILFFLLGAMAIVELIDAHDGFEIITVRIRTTQPAKTARHDRTVRRSYCRQCSTT